MNEMFRRTTEHTDSGPQQCRPVLVVKRNYHAHVGKFRQVLLVLTTVHKPPNYHADAGNFTKMTSYTFSSLIYSL